MKIEQFNKTAYYYTIPFVVAPLINLLINSILLILNLSNYYFSFWQVVTCIVTAVIITPFVKAKTLKSILTLNIAYNIAWIVIDTIRMKI
ncbi:MAG: hypothetical protein ACK4K9_09325 [Bacteroidia bacterium]